MKPETRLRNKIVKYLELEGWYTLVMHMKYHRGIPDLLCCKGGRYFLLELKIGKNKLSNIQEIVINEMRNDFKMPVCVAYSLEEVREFLDGNDL